jgi:hypothetical protein
MRILAIDLGKYNSDVCFSTWPRPKPSNDRLHWMRVPPFRKYHGLGASRR